MPIVRANCDVWVRACVRACVRVCLSRMCVLVCVYARVRVGSPTSSLRTFLFSSITCSASGGM